MNTHKWGECLCLSFIVKITQFCWIALNSAGCVKALDYVSDGLGSIANDHYVGETHVGLDLSFWYL